MVDSQQLEEGSDLLLDFGKLAKVAQTGVPVVLNTSFNGRGEPIVCKPKEAIATLFNSGLDALVLDRFLLRKVPAATG